ncbi:pyrroline-5-carboxylate reductase [Antarcticimicrobium luteum]|uniref:Pyrroline-5-carboxylate reductase n=1 Tax=Antarcticimicrobium luteum TaxID=2547397 RepID=A0A4R5V019_9RHOB|nr:pyrroline-5-carboxylate reductase [Antarcticimicrobium luteum]TDK45042.1 pyrroline-5-carboxylate reductase [Antarcticimicrobium luteum]
MSRIGFLGTGPLSAPLDRFLSRTGHDVVLPEPAQGVCAASCQTVLDRSEILFLCLPPPDAAAVLSGLVFRPDHRIVSLVADLPLAALRGLCAPTRDITRTLPLGFVELGGCPLPACPDADLLERLFAPENPVMAVRDERAFNRYLALCAMVPAVFGLMATGADWLAAETGDSGGADRFIARLVQCALTASVGDPAGLTAGRDALATGDAIGRQMIAALRQGGVHPTLRQALEGIAAHLPEA